jgi:hypothetical protein
LSEFAGWTVATSDIHPKFYKEKAAMLKSKTFTSFILPVSGLVIVLALALVCDTWIQALKTLYASTFRFTTILFLSYSVTTLLFAGAILSLFWALMTWSPRNIGVGLVYLIVGILIVFATSLYFLIPVHNLFLVSLQTILKPTSYMFISGGFIGVMGLLLLLLPKTEHA